MKKFKQYIQEARTTAGEQASKMGLRHVGRGMYADKNGKIVAKSEGGKRLVRLSSQQSADAQSEIDSTDTTTKSKNTQSGDTADVGGQEQEPTTSDGKGSVTITFGRFNPPTNGHEKLLDAVRSIAKGEDYFIYPSRTFDNKKNPLDPDTKIAFMKQLFADHSQHIINNDALRSIFDVLKQLSSEGYHSVNIVVGEDRVKEFQGLSSKYNGIEYNFEEINVVSAGDRDPDAEGVEGMSASKMRAAASRNDTQVFLSGMPKGTPTSLVKQIMVAVRTGLGLEDEQMASEMWQIAPKIYYDDLREHYYNGNIFNTGDYVQHLDTGISGKVIHRGTNYVIYIDENDYQFRGWLTQLCEGEDPETQWEIGTDKYREAVQKLTPGQPVKKFSEYRRLSKSTK